MKEKIRNAYLLFYDRVVKFDEHAKNKETDILNEKKEEMK